MHIVLFLVGAVVGVGMRCSLKRTTVLMLLLRCALFAGLSSADSSTTSVGKSKPVNPRAGAVKKKMKAKPPPLSCRRRGKKPDLTRMLAARTLVTAPMVEVFGVGCWDGRFREQC